MRIRPYRFLLILLMVALPLQTFASAAMLGCATSHQIAVDQMEMTDGAMPGCHEPDPSPPGPHNCKHCAACVLASVFPIPMLDHVATMPVVPRFEPLHVALFSGFVPEGPERPPRSVLA